MSPLLNFFSLFPHCPRVRPLIGFTDYIEITLLSNHIINIYHHCFSPSTMVFFHRHHFLFLCFVICIFSPHVWVIPLVDITDYIGSTLLSNNIITIYHHCFSPRKMASFHRQRCLLLYSEFFLWFFPTYECGQFLGLTITLELLSWDIISLLYYYISLSLLLAESCGITFFCGFYSSAMAPYHLFLLYIVAFVYFIFSLRMSVTTCCNHLLWSQFFADQSYQRNGANIFYVSLVRLIMQHGII